MTDTQMTAVLTYLCTMCFPFRLDPVSKEYGLDLDSLPMLNIS